MKFSSNRDLKTEFVFFHGVFAVGLLFYFVRRYNGFDLELAVRAGSSLLTGQSPYDISANSPFRYAPWWCVLMLPIEWVSFRFIHWGFFGCTLLMLGRIQWILLEMTPQDSPLLCRKGPFRWALILPWILVLRGLGAQIEGGNTNVLLLYLSVEGAYQFFKNRSIGLLLMWAGVGVKPQFGLLPFLLSLAYWSRVKRSISVVALFLVALWALPFPFGWDQGLRWYQDWLSVIRISSLDNLLNRTGNGNMSIFSFFVHIGHMSEKLAYVGLLIPVVGWGVYLSRKNRDVLAVLALSLWINLSFSPVSFAYTELLLVVPVFYALVFCFDRKQLIYGLPLCVLAFGEWLLSFDVVGREVFNSIVVHYRLHTWCCVPLLVYFWQSAQKRGSDNQST